MKVTEGSDKQLCHCCTWEHRACTSICHLHAGGHKELRQPQSMLSSAWAASAEAFCCSWEGFAPELCVLRHTTSFCSSLCSNSYLAILVSRGDLVMPAAQPWCEAGAGLPGVRWPPAG